MSVLIKKRSYCRCRKGWARLSSLFHAHPGFKKPEVPDSLSATILSRRQLDDRFKRIEDPIARRQRDLVMAGYPKKAKWAIVRKSRNPILKMCKNPFSMFQIQFYCMRTLLRVVQNGTRSSWLNCALRDDEAVYWVSIGRYEALAVANRWFWVSRGHLCLYKLQKVEIWSGVTDALLITLR